MKLVFGTDPEAFIRNKKTGQFVSADGIIPGSKHRPYEVEKGAVQVDGLAAEFNISPVDSPSDWVKNIKTVLAQLEEMILAVDKDFELVFVPYAEFDRRYFRKLPSRQKVLGCEEDFNVEGGVNSSPANASMPIRTAAGHIHIGWTQGKKQNDIEHFSNCLSVARYFHSLGLEDMTSEKELQNKRLMFYGMNGSFRHKPYGVELRSPDNTWLRSEQKMEEMFLFIQSKMMDFLGQH